MTYFEVYNKLNQKKNELASHLIKNAINILFYSALFIVLGFIMLKHDAYAIIAIEIYLIMYLIPKIDDFLKLIKKHNNAVYVFGVFHNRYYNEILQEIIHGIKKEYINDSDKKYDYKQKYDEYDSYTYTNYTNNDEYKYNAPIKNDKIDNAYKLFRLDKSSTEVEIKRKFKTLALKWHPDKFSNDTEENKKIANRNMQKLNAAYSEIKKYKGII